MCFGQAMRYELNAKASPYNATGNGTTDDTVAINACVAAAAALTAGSPPPSAAGICYLPQGRFRITAPITGLALAGSLQGSGEGTTIVADFAHWQSGKPYHMVDLTFSGTTQNDDINMQRGIRNIALLGTGNGGIQSWGIFESNTSNVMNQLYQLGNFTVGGVSMSQLDTGMEWQDLNNSWFSNNVCSYARSCYVFNGNDANIEFTGNQALYSVWTYTNVHTAALGWNFEQNSKYTSGGELPGPEGIQFSNNSTVAFDTDLQIAYCVSCVFSYSMFDSGSQGPLGSGYTVGIGQAADEIQIVGNYLANAVGGGTTMLINEEAGDGTTIRDNWFNGFSAGKNVGLSIAPTGGSPLNFVTITGNVFKGYVTGINFRGSMNKSTVIANIGESITSSLINLATYDFTGTIFRDNIESDNTISTINVGSSTNGIFGDNYCLGSCTNPAQALRNVGTFTFSNGATFTSGTNAPSGTCINGSLYTNQSGGASTTLYVCISATWNAVTVP